MSLMACKSRNDMDKQHRNFNESCAEQQNQGNDLHIGQMLYTKQGGAYTRSLCIMPPVVVGKSKI